MIAKYCHFGWKITILSKTWHPEIAICEPELCPEKKRNSVWSEWHWTSHEVHIPNKKDSSVKSWFLLTIPSYIATKSPWLFVIIPSYMLSYITNYYTDSSWKIKATIEIYIPSLYHQRFMLMFISLVLCITIWYMYHHISSYIIKYHHISPYITIYH